MIEDQKLLHIVLADDDEDDRELFEMALNELNVSQKLTLQPDGIKLLSYLEGNEKPDIVFLDLNMPMLMGTECLKIIRGNNRYNNLPVIILSTSNAARDIDRCYELGASYYIVKPFSYIELAGIIKKLIDKDLKENLSSPTKNKFLYNNR